jgi:hypothetical protein
MPSSLLFEAASPFTRHAVACKAMDTLLSHEKAIDSETLGIYCEAAMRAPRRYTKRSGTAAERKELGDLVESAFGLS